MGPGYGNITCTIKRALGRKSKKMKNLPRDLPCWWEQKTEEKKQTKRGINVRRKMKSLVLREEQSNLELSRIKKLAKSVCQNEIKKTKGKGLCFNIFYSV